MGTLEASLIEMSRQSQMFFNRRVQPHSVLKKKKWILDFQITFAFQNYNLAIEDFQDNKIKRKDWLSFFVVRDTGRQRRITPTHENFKGDVVEEEIFLWEKKIQKQILVVQNITLRSTQGPALLLIFRILSGQLCSEETYKGKNKLAWGNTENKENTQEQ